MSVRCISLIRAFVVALLVAGSLTAQDPRLSTTKPEDVAKEPEPQPRDAFVQKMDETFEIDLDQVAVSDLADVLTEQLSLPVILDRTAIGMIGNHIWSDSVSIQASELPLRSVLYRYLSPLELAADV
ncbi:MAG: hypothetical protein AAF664_24950, partial [Planctomycetota bacterium]